MRVVVTGDNGGGPSVASPGRGAGRRRAAGHRHRPAVSGTAGAGHTLTARRRHLDRHRAVASTTSGSAATPTAPTAPTSPARPARPTRSTDADVGHAIRVVVTATNAAGDASATSAPTAAVLPAPPVNTTQPPASTGTAVDGGTADRRPRHVDRRRPRSPTTYQWQRCDADGTDCDDIAGATDETYTPTGDDAGHAIVVVVTATNPGGAARGRPRRPSPSPPRRPSTRPPAERLRHRRGRRTLTADPGTWTGTPPTDLRVPVAALRRRRHELREYRRRDWVDLHARPRRHRPRDPRGRHRHQRRRPVAARPPPRPPAVEAAPPHDTVVPAITGAVALGQTLTADTGTWTGTAPVDFTYQWQRCDADGNNCVDIAGRDDDTYTLTVDDQGHTVVVVVTATNDAGVGHRHERAQRRAARAAGQRHRARRSTATGARRGADRRPRRLDRHRPVHLRVPVAALRLLRQQLRRHRRGDR